MIVFKYLYMAYGVIFTAMCCTSFFRLVNKGGDPFNLLVGAILTWLVFVPLPYSGLSLLSSIIFKRGG